MTGSGSWDYTHNTSGTANVPSSEHTGSQKFSGSYWIIISGTTGPSQAWFQSGLANCPINESTAFISGKNSLYGFTPSNENRDPIQASGSANVPKSESTVTH